MKIQTPRKFLSRLARRRAARMLALCTGVPVLLSAATTRQATATTLYWDADGATTIATGGTGAWDLNTSTLWRSGSPTGTLVKWTDSTGTADIADFGGFAGTVTATAGLGALGMVFETSGYSINTNAGALKLGASGININAVVGGTTSISGSAGLSLVATQSWTVATGNTLTVTSPVALGANTLTLAGVGNSGLSGIVSGTGGITKTGTGTASLSGVASTYTGITTIGGGTLSTLKLADGGTVSSLGQSTNAAANLVFDGATLQYVGTTASSTDRLFTLTANGGGIDASGTAAANTLTFSSTGALTYSGSGARTFTFSGTNTGANTFAPVLGDGTGGATSLVKTGAGGWVLTNANTYTGATTLGVANSTANGGTLTLNGTNGSIASSSGVTINGSGSRLLLDNAALTGATPDRIGNSAALTLNYGGEFQLNGSGTSGVSETETVGAVSLGSGSGIVTLSQGGSPTVVTTTVLAASSFSRGSNFATGLIRGTSIGLTGSGTKGLSQFTLSSTSGLMQIGTSTSTSANDNGTATNLKIVPYLLGASSSGSLGTEFVTYDTAGGFRRLATNEQLSIVSGSAASDTNVYSAVAANPLTGAKTFNSMLLNGVGTTANPGSTAVTVTGDGTSSLTVSSGALANVGTGGATLSAFGSIIFGNGSSNTATTINEAIITNNNGLLTISSPINTFAAGGGLTTTGAGIVVLGGANLYTGQTTVNAGTLQIGTGTAGSLAAGSGNIVLNGGNLSFGRTDTGLTIANNISGVGGVTQSGSGTTTLSGTNTYSGATTLSAGNLTLGSAAGLSSNSTVVFGGTATLNLGGFSATANNLSNTSAAASTATITNGNLTVSGAGDLSLNGAANVAFTLNATGLSSLTINKPANTVTFAAFAGSTSAATGTYNLSSTANNITATTLNIGTNAGTASTSAGTFNQPVTTVNLGTTNVINANSIQLGVLRSGGNVAFQSGLSNPTLTIRNTAGTGRASMVVGVNTAGGSETPQSSFNTTAGNIDALFSTLTVGQGGSNGATTGSPVRALFSMGTGTVDATTIVLSDNLTSPNTTGGNTSIVTFTQNAGTVNVSNLVFGQRVGVTTAPIITDVYNLGTATTSALLKATSIGTGTGAVDSTSSRGITWNNGTIQNLAGTNLTISGTSTTNASTELILTLTGATPHNFSADAGQSIMLTSSALITGNGGLTLTGAGTVFLDSASTYTGATNVNRGTLDIGGSTANGSVTGSALTLGGGTLTYTRTGANTQTFTSTTVNSGGSGVSSSTGTVALGAITRNVGGTVAFNGPGTITTSTGNLNNTSSASGTTGILGGYATYGSGDWATVSGGNIVAYAGYTEYNNVAGFSSASGKDVTDGLGTGGPGYDGSYTNSVTLNSLRFNQGNADPTININGGNNLTLTSGGILVTPNLGQKYARINGGGLTTTGADLVIQQNNTTATNPGHLQIGSSIFGSIGLTKSGVGQLDLNGSNATYTGVTTVNGGTILLAAATTGTSNVTVNNTGTVLLGANDRINDSATVTLNGGTINTGGFKEGNATGAAAATQGLGALTLSTSSILDFGSGHAGSSVLAFAASNTQTWNGTLTLLDFTPGTDFLNFASSTGLTAVQLSEISLSGFTATGLDAFGDVTFTTVPEPATWATGALMLCVLGYSQRRQVRSLLGRFSPDKKAV